MTTRDEILAMVSSVGVKEYGPLTRNWSFNLEQLEEFFGLAQAAAYERAAKVCDEIAGPDLYGQAGRAADAIRAIKEQA